MGNNATEIRTKRNPKVINRDGIKYIAAVPMIIGHAVGYFVENGILENNTLTMILTSLALFAPPIFFFSIADGYKYTSSRKKYALRLLLFAAASQIPFAILNCGTIFTLDALLNLNVFFTLLAGLLAIVLWESKLNLVLRIVGVVLIDGITYALCCEWMIFGVPIILALHIFENKPKIRFICFAVCIAAIEFITYGMTIDAFITPSFIAGTLSLLAGYFFRTVFYSGKKGKHPVFSKWFFYIVYPAHLALIYILVLLLKAKDLQRAAAFAAVFFCFLQVIRKNSIFIRKDLTFVDV